MMRKLGAVILTVVAMAATGAMAPAAAGAEDWPQYAGPTRDNCSAATGLARSWPADGPKVLWTAKLAMGFGGAAIQGGKVYVLDRPDARNDCLRVFDLTSGAEEWSFSYPAAGKVPHDGSRCTPAVDDKLVIVVSPFGEVNCISKATRKPVWTKDLVKDYGGGKVPMWGVSQSARLYKDNQVILAPQGESAGVVCLERETGKEVWRSPSIGRMQYVSPILATIDGVEQVVMVMGDGAVGVDASNGKVLWRYMGWKCQIPIPNVTPVGDGRLFITGGYKAGSAMIQVKKSPDGAFAVTELFKTAECNSQLAPALLYKEHLYANSNSNTSNDGLLCMDLTGKVLWKTEKNPNFERGHMILADGMIYIIDGKAGSLHLLEPSPAGFKELAKAAGVLGGKEIWAPLALSGGKLVIRDQQQMKCLEVGK
jgi:outer membrane protein assembly factor BamB